MDIVLTWDLFFTVFFAVIIAYSCILGREHTLKIIISSYVAILAADGLGNLMSQYLIGEQPLINIFMHSGNAQILILSKIIIFICTIILLVTRGGFQVNVNHNQSLIVSLLLTIIYAVMSAGLIISTLLLYASGISLITGNFNLENTLVLDIYKNSQISRLLINHYSAWFALPAVVFIISSFISSEPSTD